MSKDNWVRFTIETADGEKETMDVPSIVPGIQLRRKERLEEVKRLAFHVVDVFCSKKAPTITVFEKNKKVVLDDYAITVLIYGKNGLELKTIIDTIVPVLENITSVSDINICHEVLG